MPTSNSLPQVSPATDSPLGAPPGQEPYKTIRAKNWAQDDKEGVGQPGNNIYTTDRAGNTAALGDKTAPAAKPVQGA